MSTMYNGQAFPQGPGHLGMTMRDYFAAKALAGILASNDEIDPGAAAKISYRFADAMLAARGARS